jgi:glutathione gamma-glutamylcysteinyltransferase
MILSNKLESDESSCGKAHCGRESPGGDNDKETQQVGSGSVERKESGDHTCHDAYIDRGLPFPPIPRQPNTTFHKRELPSAQIQFSSKQGKEIFQEALLSGMANAYFPLSEQFLSQSDPAFCGIAALIMILNAMGIDPNVVWKGPWRWYGSEEMILQKCRIDPERVRRAGILMEEFLSLARCQGLRVDMKRPCAPSQGDALNPCHTISNFRKDIINSTMNPPSSSESDGDGDVENDGAFLVVAYSRKILGQTGSGHFSPVAAYSKETDQVLILDVARFKYPPYWVSVELLYEALRPEDVVTNKSRGWFMMYPPSNGKKVASTCTAAASLENEN